MIAHELQFRFSHYALLVVIESVLFALYLFSSGTTFRLILSVAIGILYAAWGLWTHRSELHTPRLVLEYVAVGTLGAVILGILAQTV